MSARRNLVWRAGEDWGVIVDCYDSDNTTPITVRHAWFAIGTEDGLILDLDDQGNPSAVYFDGNTVTVAIPVSLRHGIINDVYDYVVRIEDANEVQSDQLAGTIQVQRSLFPEQA